MIGSFNIFFKKFVNSIKYKNYSNTTYVDNNIKLNKIKMKIFISKYF